MATEQRTGLFAKHPKMTPDNVRRWLDIMRAELGWTIAEAAARAEIDVADVETLERTGETEELANEMARLAGVYCYALYGSGDAWRDAEMRRDALAVFGNSLHLASFELAGVCRRQRKALGLSLAEVRAALMPLDEYLAREYEWIEWGQRISGSGDFDDIARVLQIPAVELLRLNGDFTTEDLEEWFAWRKRQDAQRKKAPRRAA